jgi:hypothetical protein
MNMSKPSVIMYVGSTKSDLVAESVDSFKTHEQENEFATLTLNLRANEVSHTDPKPYAMGPSNEGGSADKIVSKIVDRKKSIVPVPQPFCFLLQKKQRKV